MPKKILVVDDERPTVHFNKVILERAGYEVVTAFDGKNAMEKVETENPDLVILDISLPDIDGFEVLKNLRLHPTTCELPVVMMQERRADADVYRFEENSGIFFRHKSLNPVELIAFVRRILSDQEGSEVNLRELMVFFRHFVSDPEGSEATWSEADWSKDNTAIPTPPAPAAPAQPVSWWRKVKEVWHKIGF